MTTAPHRRRLPPGASRALALIPGLALAALLAGVDAWLQPDPAVIGIVVLAPMVDALFGTPRDVAGRSSEDGP